MSTPNACCERCGRRIEVNRSRKRAVVVCFDCRYSDPEYLRLRTSNACGTRDFAGVSAVESGQKNGPDRSVRALQPGPSPTEAMTIGRGASMVLAQQAARSQTKGGE